MTLTLITCTGMRPVAFNICKNLMKAQTFTGNVQWLVTIDTDEKLDVPAPNKNWSVQLIPGPKKWREGINTQRPNLEAALQYISGDKVLIIEDDDWYSPRYIEYMSNVLDYASLAGEGRHKYYHVQVPGIKTMQNLEHASLCATGFRKSLLDQFERAINSGEIFIDVALWNIALREKLERIIFTDKNISVGMKGIPGGRDHIGIGNKNRRDYMYDVGHAELRKIIGADVKYYEEFSSNK